VLRTLKPDISAPGDRVLAHGYAYGETGMDILTHYGVSSGTSVRTHSNTLPHSLLPLTR
jgi:hypothetical protein